MSENISSVISENAGGGTGIYWGQISNAALYPPFTGQLPPPITVQPRRSTVQSLGHLDVDEW